MWTIVSKARCPALEVPVNVADPDCSDGYRKLSVCTFKCNPGYHGIPNGVYEVTCQTNETWDSPASDCESKFTDRIQRFFSTMIIIYSNKNATDTTYEKTTDM